MIELKNISKTYWPQGRGLASDKPEGNGLASFGQSHSQSQQMGKVEVRA
jgi:hypothetical protein